MPALQRFRQAVIQRNDSLGGVSLAAGLNCLVSVREGSRAAYGDRLFFEVNIPIDVQIERFSAPESGKHHGHGAGAEVMLVVCLDDELLLPLLQAAVFSVRSLRRLGQISGCPDDHAVLHRSPEYAPDCRYWFGRVPDLSLVQGTAYRRKGIKKPAHGRGQA